MPEATAQPGSARLREKLRKLRPALWPALAIVLALVPACVGITWGLPSKERFARVTGERRAEAVGAIIRRTKEDTPRKARGLAIVPLDIGKPDTPGRMWRRFALYSDHPDEMLVFFALSRMKPSRLDLDPGTWRYGGLFFYPLGAAYATARMFGLAVVSRDLNVYLEDPGRFGRLYLIGRLYVLAWHAAGLVALFLLARELFSYRAAYLALAVYALLPATVCFSHVMKPHVPGVAPVLLAVLVLRRASGLKGYVAAGALTGAAASMIPLYAISALFLPAFLWERRGVRASWKPLACSLGAAVVVFAALNPFMCLRPGKVLAETGYLAGTLSLGPTWLMPVAFLRYLPDALTWPGVAAALAACTWLVLRRRELARTLGIPLAACFVMISCITARAAAGPVTARFGCLLYPFIALFTAGAVERLLSGGGRLRWGGLAAGAALVVALGLGSVPYLAAHAANARGGGTRVGMGRYIESHVRAGSTIGARGRLAPYRTPTFDLGRYALVDAHFDPEARPAWFLTVDREMPPPGYSRVARVAPFGLWPGFGSPERMSFAGPGFTLWGRE